MKFNFIGGLLIAFVLTCNNNVKQSQIKLESVHFENRSFRTWKEGWLIVPENRTARNSNYIELPFIFSEKPDSVDNNYPPVLIMSGGPGNGSLHMANGIVNTPWGKERDIIVLDQRGTHFSKPALHCPEIDSMRIQGLKNGLWGAALDSLKMTGTNACYDRLIAQGIDLNGYNTLESVEDLEALRTSLQIDKWILYGMSYSCNLMTTYAQTYPEKVIALILDSPLPHQSNYDEEAFQNIDSILIRTIKNYAGTLNLYEAWKSYIRSIENTVFRMTIDAVNYSYTKNELIDILFTKLSDHSQLVATTESLKKIIEGNHEEVVAIIKGSLAPTGNALGMRYSVWISEELPEEKLANIKKSEGVYPWLKGYPANDVSFATAKYWKVESIYKNRKWPTTKYDGPALILSGELDPWTPDWYGKKMLDFVPNAQQLIYKEKTHLPGFTTNGFEDIHRFLNQIES